MGYVEIRIEHHDESGNITILAKAIKDLPKQNGYITESIDLKPKYKEQGFEYGVNCPKPTHICLMFCSSTYGKEKKQSAEQNISVPNITDSKMVATLIGNALYIDNIKFEYKND